MNKLRVIDLLNKIANGEEVPKEIYYKNQWWNYNPKNDYEGTDWGGCFLNNVLICELNDEVEIIEDEFIDIEEITIRDKTIGFPNGEWTARNMDKAFSVKINNLIKNQKKIIERLDKNE